MAVPRDESRAVVDAPGDVLAELRGALDALFALDAVALCDGATVVELWQQLARAEALACRQAASFGRGGEWPLSGAQTAVAWMRVETRCDRAQATSRVRRGRAVCGLDHVDDAFAAGLIGVDHVDRLTKARARSRQTALAFGRDEAMLVEWAATMQFDDFVTALEMWLYRADAEGAERRAERQHRRRRFHLSPSFENAWYANGVFDEISGSSVHDVLSRIEGELFDTDWADAKLRLGRDPLVDELARTAPQRRADALVEMARRAETTPKDGQRPAPLFTVLIGVDAFRRSCELASGACITPGAAARWVNESMIERIVFDGPDRVISVGRRRAFTGALRRAIQVRDRTCAHPYCETRAEDCEVDHVKPFALGGLTTEANGRLRCGFDNRLRNPEHLRRTRRTGRARDPDRLSADE